MIDIPACVDAIRMPSVRIGFVAQDCPNGLVLAQQPDHFQVVFPLSSHRRQNRISPIRAS